MSISTTSALQATTSYGPFSKYIDVYGLKILGLSGIGSQPEVQDEFLKKTAQTFKLLLNPSAIGIDPASRTRALEGLNTYNVIQRVGVDSYDAYSPSLDSGSYPGWNQVNDDNNATDFIWHLRDRNGNFSPSGKNQTAETLEHALHTLSQFALPAAFPEELNVFSENGQADGISSDLADAYQEAVRNGVYDPSDYSDANDGSDSYAQLLLREYVYCLIFAEWGFTQALIEGGSLAPEWSDAHLSPTAIARDNPIGHRLFTNYISKIISKPSLQDLSLMFQDGDQGRSGYLPSSGEAIPEAPQPDAPLAPDPSIPSPQKTPTTVSQPIPEPAQIPSPAVDPQPIPVTEAPPPTPSATPTPAPAPGTTTSTTTRPSIAGPITTLLSAPLSEAKGHLNNLKPKQFSNLKPAQLSAFRPGLFQAISASQIKALSTRALNAIAPAQLDKLKPNAFKGFQTRHARALKPKHISILDNKQLAAFRPVTLAAFSPRQIKQLKPAALSALTPKQFSKLPPKTLAAFSAKQFQNIAASLFRTLSGQQLAAFEKQDLNALSSNQLKAIPPKSIDAVKPNLLNSLKPDQIAAFTLRQLRAFSRKQQRRLSSTFLDNLSTKQRRQLNFINADPITNDNNNGKPNTNNNIGGDSLNSSKNSNTQDNKKNRLIHHDHISSSLNNFNSDNTLESPISHPTFPNNEIQDFNNGNTILITDLMH